MTHDDLVKRAGRWLRNSAKITNDYGSQPRVVRCSVVATELTTAAWEKPDAIGWLWGGLSSILVECKISRNDFKADAKKPFRRHPKSGMGRFRYYMTPKGMIQAKELPEKWGLLESTGRQVKVIKLAEQHQEYNERHEVQMLWSLARRNQQSPQEQFYFGGGI